MAASSSEMVPLTVRIMGKDYQVSCPANEKDALIDSARYLDERMEAIRKRSAGLGAERIAVMTALNMARELLDRPRGRRTAGHSDEIDERVQQLQLKIDAELQQD